MTDADVGINSEVDFSLSPSAASLFSLQSSGPRSTELSISHLLDRENVDVYSFSLFAIDRGSPQRTGSTATTINITVRIKEYFGRSCILRACLALVYLYNRNRSASYSS